MVSNILQVWFVFVLKSIIYIRKTAAQLRVYSGRRFSAIISALAKKRQVCNFEDLVIIRCNRGCNLLLHQL